MPEHVSLAEAVLSALGFAPFARDASGTLRASGEPPNWLRAIWPNVDSAGAELNASELSPFLDNFLVDAEECWRAGGDQRARSGPWVEQEGVQLEATALTVDGQSLLLVERLGEAFEAKKAMLQTARENVIAYQRLNSETQKKEILLHCVAEEMSGALANVITSLRLLESEDSSAQGRHLLGLASRAATEQQALINKVLTVFADELTTLAAQNGLDAEADLRGAMDGAVGGSAGAFAEKKVRLVSSVSSGEPIVVPLDTAHLEHVIANLLENSLERTPAGGEVELTLEETPEAVVLRVDDSGPRVSQDACDDLFSKRPLAEPATTRSALRLHFCRMTLENCGGEIGCARRETKGNRFWIRLPRRTR
jgi:signal transduction histidine kinase